MFSTMYNVKNVAFYCIIFCKCSNSGLNLVCLAERTQSRLFHDKHLLHKSRCIVLITAMNVKQYSNIFSTFMFKHFLKTIFVLLYCFVHLKIRVTDDEKQATYLI